MRRGWSTKPGGIEQFLKKFQRTDDKPKVKAASELSEEEKKKIVEKSKRYWRVFLGSKKQPPPKPKKTNV